MVSLKLVVVLFFFTFLAMPACADILANGNFADGTAHWRGDGHAADQGLIINLDPKKWTKISQTFNTHESKLQFNVTYRLSDDCSLAGGPSRTSTSILDQNIFAELTGVMCLPFQYSMPSNVWTAYIFDPASQHFESIQVYSTSRDDQKTFSGFLNNLVEHEEKMLYLIFSPGTGSVTLTSVSLTPFQATSP